jgi:predicted alpha-1,2-mannosidase
MVNLSPDTRAGGDPWSTGYRYTDKYIHWFSHIHAWQLCGVQVMPTSGKLRGHEGSEKYKSGFSHDSETVRPGYHSVYLDDYSIRAELTSTVRVGFHRYTFDSKDPGWVVMGLGENIMSRMSDCLIQYVNSRELKGFVENDRTLRRKKKTKIFFHIVFDRDIQEFQTWRNGELKGFKDAIAGEDAGAAARFNPEEGSTLQMKVAISYCGTSEAAANLYAELPHWDFDRVRGEASEEWNDMLSRIEVEGGSDALKTKFYTDLFHALKGRRRVSDADGKYLDMTGDLPKIRRVPLDEDGKPLYEHHNSDSLWGAPWSINLLWAMAYPEITSNFCNMLVDMYKDGGLIPRGPSGGDYTFVMTSPTSTPFLVSAYMQGIRNFDVETAYLGMLKNHGPGGLMSKAGYEYFTCNGGGVEYYLERGYVPLGIKADALHVKAAATMTLEYAYHDWALAQMAKALGKEADYTRLMQRAQNYRNIWNPETRFMQPRNMYGEFLDDFDPMDSLGWEEGNGHHYRWYVPHDIAGLIRLMGGENQFVDELDSLFLNSEDHKFVAPHGKHHTRIMDYGNQPCTYLAHLFNYSGAPWLSQKWVRRVMEKAKSDVTPFGGYGGDEDQGLMGALNVLMAIGLFNVQGGCNSEPFYEISTPAFDRITIHLSPRYHSGRKFTITTVNNGPGDRYIQKAELNGQSLDRPWFHHKHLAKGGGLNITLGTNPNTEWGSASSCTPPSMSQRQCDD